MSIDDSRYVVDSKALDSMKVNKGIIRELGKVNYFRKRQLEIAII